MTAEIAVMNKSAVALAADSAVTIGSDRGQKIFNTVNKLFTLSKYQPVAVMVYGNAQIMGVPWETIIKIYRKKIGRRRFAHLEDYANDFLHFLRGNRSLFSKPDQQDYFEMLVSAFYQRINKDIQDRAKKHLEKSGRITTAETREIVQLEIEKHFNELKACKYLPGFTDQFATKLVQKYLKLLNKLYEHFFQKLPLPSRARVKLCTMSGWLFVRDNFRLHGTSGVVIAGFGEGDIYPRLSEFTVEGVIEDKLRYTSRRQVRIGIDTSASIVPFAQSEVVASFIDGMDPGMERLLNKFLDGVFANYPSVLLNHLPKLTAATKADAVKKTKAASEQILKKFREEFDKFRRKTLVDPIVSTVAVLPKDELAAMAEVLVSLTSFKRRYSLDAETVGGPVDVAVLSKGDGFVWIKRKHYFKPELNPHFLTNYFE
jgi:hypothetical protein